MKIKNNIKLYPALILLLTFFILTINQGFSQDQYARSIIKKLTSKEYRGRGYVFGGDRKAAKFISEEFKRMGLKPLNGKSFYQKYILSANVFPGTVDVKIDDEWIVTGHDYLIDAASPSIKGKFSIVDMPLAYLTSDRKVDSIISIAKGKFILIDEAEDQGISVDEKIAAKMVIERLKKNENTGFRGLILVTNDKLTWRSLTYQNAKAVVIIDKKSIENRDLKTIELTVDSKLIPNYETQNVVAILEGTVPSDSILVVTAHYDHIGALGKKVYFPGANDNASGTAMLLALADYYSKNKPKHTIVFLAFSGEEIGLLGSKHFVENPLFGLSKIKFLINLDMAGTGDDGIQVVNGTIFKKEYDLLVQLNEEHHLLPAVKVRGPMSRSDHHWFYENQVPSFFIYTLGGIAAYHDIYDIEATLPLTNFNNYSKLLKLFINELDTVPKN